MRIEGEHRFSLPRTTVWELLQDPDVIRQAVPGCKTFDEVAPDTYELTAQVGIGPVRGSFKGKVAMSDREPEERYTLHAEGSGRPGSATGEAVISLADDGDGTHLTFDADVTIRGAIGRVGGRLLTSSARGMARQFFESIERDAKAAAQEGAAT